jgi:Flp pilus assembly protein TadD
MSQSSVYEMNLKVDPFVLRILPKGTQPSNGTTFTSLASGTIRDLFNDLGGVITAMSIDKSRVKLTWKADDANPDPLGGIVKLLEGAKYNEAILLLEFFKSASPDEPDFLYNLGMAYSDTGALDPAVENLRHLLDLAPEHVNGRVALGVALLRKDQDQQAAVELRKAVRDDPANPWAQRNLGACLMRLGEYQEALPHLKQAAELNPGDDRAWFGLGQAYELTGNPEEADTAYLKVLEVDEYGEAAEQARQARSKLAQKSFRSVTPGTERPDAVMYCLGALEKFENMSPDKVRQIGFEVAMLGMNGIDVNDPTPKYSLKSLPGEYSGLHLLCLEYVSFKQFAPDQNIGFDLAAEYRSALSMYESRKGSTK